MADSTRIHLGYNPTGGAVTLMLSAMDGYGTIHAADHLTRHGGFLLSNNLFRGSAAVPGATDDRTDAVALFRRCASCVECQPGVFSGYAFGRLQLRASFVTMAWGAEADRAAFRVVDRGARALAGRNSARMAAIDRPQSGPFIIAGAHNRRWASVFRGVGYQPAVATMVFCHEASARWRSIFFVCGEQHGQLAGAGRISRDH